MRRLSAIGYLSACLCACSYRFDSRCLAAEGCLAGAESDGGARDAGASDVGDGGSPDGRLACDGSWNPRLDPAFGQGGVASFDLDGVPNTNLNQGNAHAIDSQGRHLLGGVTQGVGHQISAVIRVQPDGRGLDGTFGVAGVARIDLGVLSYATGVLVDPDGSSFAGHKIDGASGLPRMLTRLNPQGALDSGFGVNGVARRAGDPYVTDMLSRDPATGDLFLSGQFNRGGVPQFDLSATRFTPLGEVVASFGNGGVAFTDFPGEEFGSNLTWSAAGGFYLSGGNYGAAGWESVTYRFGSNGTLDTTWANAGERRFAMATGDVGCSSLRELADGSTLCVGSYVPRAGEEDLLVARFTPSGALDPSFGTGGVWTYDNPGAGVDQLAEAVLLPDGSFLAVGELTVGGAADAVVLLLAPEGRLVPEFGNGGVFSFDLGSSLDLVLQATLDGQGRLVIEGLVDRTGSNADFALGRVLLDTCSR